MFIKRLCCFKKVTNRGNLRQNLKHNRDSNQVINRVAHNFYRAKSFKSGSNFLTLVYLHPLQPPIVHTLALHIDPNRTSARSLYLIRIIKTEIISTHLVQIALSCKRISLFVLQVFLQVKERVEKDRRHLATLQISQCN